VVILFLFTASFLTGTLTTGTLTTVVLADDGLADTLDLFVLLLDLLGVLLRVRVHPTLTVGHLALDLFLLLVAQLILQGLVDLGIKGVHVTIKLVLLVNSFLNLLILILELLGLLDHPVDLILSESALIVGDGDLFLLTGTLIFLTDVEDTIAINFESDFDLRLTPRSRRNSTKLELTQQVVILGHGPLTFEHLNVDSGLVILISGENLRFLGGDDSVPTNQFSHDTTNGLNTKSQRSNIQQKKILTTFTRENTTLDLSTISNLFIGVNTSVGFLTVEEFLDQGLNLRDPGRTTDKDNLINL